MGFSRQEYCSGLPFPPPGDPPDPGIEPESLMSPAAAEGFFTSSATANPAVSLTRGFLHSILDRKKPLSGRAEPAALSLRSQGRPPVMPQWARMGTPALEKTHVTSVVVWRKCKPRSTREETQTQHFTNSPWSLKRARVR